ncbi:MAG: hypothetical protein HC934_05025 [Acaryochloridaceae cyanobacterium SU_2_1]|nr:hypothetical protein [Acaryochloridaceae cyanobacterium SU_2_1]
MNYLYESQPLAETNLLGPATEALNPAQALGQLSQLPVPELLMLMQAALELDTERVEELMTELELPEPELGQALTELAQNFQFDKITEACQAVLLLKGELDR